MRPLLSSFITLVPVAFCQYVLQDDYLAGPPLSFGNNFNFFTGNDPTNGYVNYLDSAAAVQSGLLSQLNDGSIYMGVDHSNPATGRGRDSIRIESKKSYNHGLFILDLAHMPGGQCATWPAFWMSGDGGLSYSELDIIEGVNLDSTSVMSLKTNQACSISQQVMTGTLKTTDCNVNTGGLVGCSIDSTSAATYGTGFNSLGGGVYATEWNSNGITIWYFPRNAIPADITAGTPNPQLWGVPLSKFTTSCNLDENFANQHIVMNIDFCGDYAGDPYWYNQNPTCLAQAASCVDFVRDNPGAFVDTYWHINQLKVYQLSTTSTTTSSPTSLSLSTTSISSTSSPSPVPVSTTLGSGSSSSTSSHSSEASTTSGVTIIPDVTLTTTTGNGVFTEGLPQSSTSNIQPIGGSTTTSSGDFVFTSGLPLPSSSSNQPIDGSTTTSTSFFIYTGLPQPPSSNIGPSTTLTTTPSSPAGSTSTTTALSSTAGPTEATPSTTTSQEYVSLSTSSSMVGPIGSSTTTPLLSQSSIVPLPGSTSTSSSHYLTSSSSMIIDPNLGSTTSSTSTEAVTQATSTSAPASSSPSPSISSSSIGSKSTKPSTKSTISSSQSGNGAWGGPGVSSAVITTTLKGTWVEPCPTGLTTRTTAFVTTHCGCTEQPLPSFSLTTTTITCPLDWPITTPFVVVKPVRPEPTGHEVIVTTDRSGKTITITGPVVSPTKTVVVPVTVLPVPPAGPNNQGHPGAPSGNLLTKTGSPSGLDPGHGVGAGGSAPTPPIGGANAVPSASGAAAPSSGVGAGGSGGSGYQINSGSSGNNGDSTNGHQAGGTDGGDSGSGSNNGGSYSNVDSNGHGNQGAAPSSSTWIGSYTGAAAPVLASSTLFMALAIVAFIFLELSVV